MKPFMFIAVLFPLCTTLLAQDSLKIKVLELRIRDLEGRVERLERFNASPRLQDIVRKMEQAARARAMQDSIKYNPAYIKKAEALYFKASRLMRSNEPEALRLLDSLVTAYPQLNRAGCAQLYRAQLAEGAEKERLLNDCIDRFGDCYYFDGAQVGPLAMFKLGQYYIKEGKEDETRKLYERIKKEHPEAIDHSNQLLIDQLRL